MTDTTKQIAGVDIERLMRNLNDTSYQEGVMDLACRLTDCKAVIEELLAARATPVSAGQSDLSEQLREYASNPGYSHSDYADTMREAADALDRHAAAELVAAAQSEPSDGEIYQMVSERNATPEMRAEVEAHMAEIAASVGAQVAEEAKPELTVWYGAMPESNGKSNFTAILMRKGASMFDTDSYTFARSEYPDRVRYEADCMRYLIGERHNKPWILDYDDEKHSGYTAPVPAPATVPENRTDQADAWLSVAQVLTEVVPGWGSDRSLTGEQCAIAAIRELAKRKAAPATVDRNSVIEECAELVNDLACGDDPLAPEEVRDRIRALKDKAAPAAQAAVPDWAECARIADLPAVDMALENFSHDSTADNAICIVRAALESLAAPAAVPQGVDRDAIIEQCAKIAADFGPDRPIVSERPSDLIIGRWEGENAASVNIAKTIRALKGNAAPATLDRDAIIEQCAKACEAENLGAVDNPIDRGYNVATNDCAKAIRALKAAPASTRDGAQCVEAQCVEAQKGGA